MLFFAHTVVLVFLQTIVDLSVGGQLFLVPLELNGTNFFRRSLLCNSYSQRTIVDLLSGRTHFFVFIWQKEQMPQSHFLLCGQWRSTTREFLHIGLYEILSAILIGVAKGGGIFFSSVISVRNFYFYTGYLCCYGRETYFLSILYQ